MLTFDSKLPLPAQDPDRPLEERLQPQGVRLSLLWRSGRQCHGKLQHGNAERQLRLPASVHGEVQEEAQGSSQNASEGTGSGRRCSGRSQGRGGHHGHVYGFPGSHGGTNRISSKPPPFYSPSLAPSAPPPEMSSSIDTSSPATGAAEPSASSFCFLSCLRISLAFAASESLLRAA